VRRCERLGRAKHVADTGEQDRFAACRVPFFLQAPAEIKRTQQVIAHRVLGQHARETGSTSARSSESDFQARLNGWRCLTQLLHLVEAGRAIGCGPRRP